MLFVNNGYWKLLSLVVSAVIYFSIRSDISHFKTVVVPVEAEFERVAGGAAIEAVEPRSVQVTLRGSFDNVNQIASSALRCVVRPRQKKNVLRDTVEIKLGGANVAGARGVRVTKIEPGVAVVKFDIPMSLRLDVAAPEVVGKARGRVELVYEQTNAVVKGSRRLLSTLDATKVRIQPEAIDVDGRTQSFSKHVRLFPPGDPVGATVEPAEMVVNVLVISERATAKLDRVPVIVLQPYAPDRSWRTAPAWVDVELTGKSEVVKGVKVGDVTASVSLPESFSAAGTNEVPVVIHVRQGLSFDEVSAVPPAVRLVRETATPGVGN
jgi:hypothetical protein